MVHSTSKGIGENGGGPLTYAIKSAQIDNSPKYLSAVIDTT